MAQRSKKRQWVAFLVGTLIIALTGALLIVGNQLADASYDLPFSSRLRTDISVPEMLIVYLDKAAQDNLQQTNTAWDRELHARLVETLTRAGARLVFFDVIFREPRDRDADQRLAAAIRDNEKVVLGGDYDLAVHRTGSDFNETVQFVPPFDLLRTNAAGWGLLRLRPVDEKQTAREIFTGIAQKESAIWLAAELGGAPATRNPAQRFRWGERPREPSLAKRWFNFYGPPYTLHSISLETALDPSTTTNLFRDKYVFVGGHPSVFEKDQFATPYSRGGGAFAPGVEILATGFLNLVRGDWLERMPTARQLLLAGLWAIIVTGALLQLRPWHAAWVTLLAVLGFASVSFYLQWHQRLWWSWLVPAAVQTPMAFVWSIGYQYAFEYRQRRKLRKAFSVYLPPPLVERIAETDADLSLGGKEVEATVMFTDLEGFTAMSETLTPTQVSELLTTYFNRTTKSILEQEGTIIKYIGDAVMAVWGAPLEDAAQADRAVLAALGMVAASREPVNTFALRTRIGINTGPTLAGNLGSDFRFDYTLIGATTNLASRLEGLNQLLGTNILISDSTRQRLNPKIKVRHLGQFLLKGKANAIKVYEVIDQVAADPSVWTVSFEQAVELFSRREFESSQKGFQAVIDMRGGKDGPAEFYLRQIAALRGSLRTADSWDGVINITSKDGY